MGKAWHDMVYRLYDQADGDVLAFPSALAPAPELPAPSTGVEMMWHNILTVWSIGASSAGMVAEVVTPLPSNLSWAFVVFAGIPAVTLGMRLAYWAFIRWLEHRERMVALTVPALATATAATVAVPAEAGPEPPPPAA